MTEKLSDHVVSELEPQKCVRVLGVVKAVNRSGWLTAAQTVLFEHEVKGRAIHPERSPERADRLHADAPLPKGFGVVEFAADERKDHADDVVEPHPSAVMTS